MYKQAENDAWSGEYCSSHFLKSSQQKHTPRVCFGSLVSVITVRLQDCCEVESREPLFKYYQNGV